MKRVKFRASFALLIAAALLMGLGLYVARFVRDGADWAAFSANNSIYQNGVLNTGTITDRSGILLAHAGDGVYRYADDAAHRISCLHAVGDYAGYIGAGALQLFSKELGGYDSINGTYDPDAQGGTVALSIDAALSAVAYEALAGQSGAVAVSNYKTGELLCMVSSPAYDPNGSLDPALDGVYLNRVTGAAYTPGSVFKIVTLAAAIECIDDIYSRTFWCEGGVTVGGSYIKCSGSHGSQTIEQAFANSCNCAFAELSLELGAETLSEYASALGVTELLTLCGASTAAGRFDAEKADDVDLAWSGIGQSTNLTSPYAMLRLVSAIAGDGAVQEPTLLKDGQSSATRLLKPSTAELIADFMRYNVVNSYGEWNFPGLKLCAKSGTAEVGDGTSHAWFTGFLQDADHPYAFVVVVEHGGGGLRTAGAVANTVLQAACADESESHP